MRILKIVFNAEIKYQQCAKLIKFIDRDFWCNFDLRKTHKGKTSERAFYYLWASEKLFYSIFIFRNLHKLIWTFL